MASLGWSPKYSTLCTDQRNIARRYGSTHSAVISSRIPLDPGGVILSICLESILFAPASELRIRCVSALMSLNAQAPWEFSVVVPGSGRTGYGLGSEGGNSETSSGKDDFGTFGCSGWSRCAAVRSVASSELRRSQTGLGSAESSW